ncbi:MAG TPA: N-6 DNA methylase, partial [Fibrobacteraceae bacterium]|nr:N-6 DNA methylase [Fibrobacteraceae bacterium]
MPLTRSIEILRQAGISREEIPVLLASLLLLRWVDFQDAEAEAVALFEGEAYSTRLPRELQWRTWATDPSANWLTLARSLSSPFLSIDNGLGEALETTLLVFRETQLRGPSARELFLSLEALPFETREQQADLGKALFLLALQANPQEMGTPVELARFMVSMAQVRARQSLFDPFFRLGESFEAALPHSPELLAGSELSPVRFLVAFTALTLQYRGELHLACGNGLEQEVQSIYDVALCTPPWGMSLQDSWVSYLPVPARKSESAYLQRCLQSVKREGCVVCCLPMGFLISRGQERKIREWILKSHGLEWVIQLPPGTFAPAAQIRTAVVVLRKGVSAGITRFVHCSKLQDLTDLAEQLHNGNLPPNTAEVLSSDLLEQNVEWVNRSVPLQLDPLARFESHSQLQLFPLSDLATVSLGPVIPAHDLSDKPETDHPVPYFRIGDIENGKLSRPNRWLTEKAFSHITNKSRLRAGNILVSGLGTLGKTAVVANGATGGLASSALYVLQLSRMDLDPYFLATYLGSPEIRQAWSEKASSSTVPRISIRDLQQLRIPVPSLPLQGQVLAMVREKQMTVLECLDYLLSGEGRNPVLAWARRNQSRMQNTAFQEAQQTLQTVSLEAREIQTTQIEQEELRSWFQKAQSILNLATEVGKIPRSAALLTVLTTVQEKWKTVCSEIPQHFQGELGKFTEALGMLLVRLCDELDRWIDPQVELLQTPQGIGLRLYNKTPMPMRSMQITLRFPSRSVDLTYPYFPEGKEELLDLLEWNADLLSLSGQNLLVEWRVQAMQGKEISGAVNLAIPSGLKADERPWKADECSPYVTGDPIRPDRKDVFFGRE